MDSVPLTHTRNRAIGHSTMASFGSQFKQPAAESGMHGAAGDVCALTGSCCDCYGNCGED